MYKVKVNFAVYSNSPSFVQNLLSGWVVWRGFWPVHLARFLNLSLKNMLKIPPNNVLVIGNSKHCIGFIAVANYQIVFSLFFSRFKFIEENS